MRARRMAENSGEADGLGPAGGFTLVELVVVITLAGLIMAIAIPQLVPTILLSKLEGSARHLAGYGRAAMAHAVIAQERLTIRINLTPADDEPQEYWTVRWVTEYDLEEGGGGLFGDSAFGLVDDGSPGQRMPGGRGGMYQPGSEEDVAAKALAMQERFERFAMIALQSQARNVRHEGLLSEIGSLFEGKEFTLGGDDEDSVDEVKTPLLERTRLPDGIHIESVRVGGSERTGGMVEVDVTPLGLAEPVQIILRGKRDDYYTVAWDAITGNAHIYEGKKDSF